MKRLTVLFAGLGSVGQRHLRNLVTVSPHPPRLLAWRTGQSDRILSETMGVEAESGLAARYGIEVFGELDGALAARPDLVIVANPTSLHVSTALAAARAGCHLFVEKPLGHGCDDTATLIAEVEARQLVAHVGFQMRFHPAIALIEGWLTGGLLGEPVAVAAEVGEYLPGFHPWEDYRDGYAARPELGGGVVLTQTHEIDLLVHLFGTPRRVYSVGGRLGELGLAVEDTASSLLTFARADGTPWPCRLHQDYLQRPARRRLDIVGRQGRAEWDILGGSLMRWDGEGKLVERHDFSQYPRNRLFEDQMRHLLACVAGEERPRVPLRQALASLETALAIRQSLESGRPVEMA